MQQAKVIDMDSEIAINAASLNYFLKLPMADAMILASTNKVNATLWTQDSDFDGIAGVQYFPKSN